MPSPFKHPRTGVYYVRRWIPEDLRDALGRREYLKSLGTKDAREAKRLFADANAECEAMFARARLGAAAVDELDDAQIKQIADAWLSHTLEEDDELRLEEGGDRAHRKRQETIDIVLPSLKDDLAKGVVDDSLAYEVDDFLKSHGYNIPTETPQFRRVAMAILRSWVRALQLQLDRQRGEPVDTPVAPAIGPKRSTAAPDKSNPLSTVFEAWKRERKPSEKVWSEWSLVLSRFTQANSDLPVGQITRDHMRKFKDALLERELGIASIKKHLSAMRSVLGWAVENGLSENNPAAGVTVRGAKVTPEARLPYDESDLRLILGSPIYSEARRPQAGGGEAAYWLPLMALYMGCRLEELGQALASDVVRVSGTLCLDINDRGAGKSVKATSSRRIVPIHPELLRLGFEKYVESVKASERLFPALKPDRFGKWTGNFSKWWGRWARDLGISDRRKVFHSFRHTFKLACRRARIEEETHDRLTGHSGGGVGRSYGRTTGDPASLVDVLSEAIAKVGYAKTLPAVALWRPRSS